MTDGIGKRPGAARAADDGAVLADFLENFALLASVPRPSGHERAVSDRLKAWAEAAGCRVRQDAAGNLVIDVPATEGCEGLPLVALQAHLDMVCVAREGVRYDPLADPIRVVAEGDVLRAEGTSLGADDGAGVAIAMSVLGGKMAHGPVRALFTVDEEVGMTGALAITREDLAGVEYLVNIDSERSDTVTVGSAAASIVSATAVPRLAAPAGDTALEISVSGLLGGHSGMAIGEGRCNGIAALAEVLAELGKAVPAELASFAGGTVDNAIPARASAVVVVAGKDREAAEALAAAKTRELRARFAGREKAPAVSVAAAAMPAAVLAAEQAAGILAYVAGTPDGALAVSGEIAGFVETSSNLGKIAAGPDGVEIRQMPRSSVPGRLREIEARQKALGASCGLEVGVSGLARAWPVDPGSVLAGKVRDIYRELNGGEIRVAGIHAGLECGVFAELAAGLDMVSIGPDLRNVHSPDETLFLPSVPKTWRLLERLLVSLG